MSALLGEPVEESAAPVAAAAAPVAPAAQAAAPAAPEPSGPISAEVAKWVAEGKKWSKSTIAAEQARRGRKSLPALTASEVAALLGEPAAAEAPAAAPVAAAVAKPVAAAPGRVRGRRRLRCQSHAAVSQQPTWARPRLEPPERLRRREWRQPDPRTTTSIRDAGVSPGLHLRRS